MSDTVKVVIEIPTELYAYHKYGVPLSEVLAEIKAEINEERYPNDEFHEGMERALDIINKHIGKGDSE